MDEDVDTLHQRRSHLTATRVAAVVATLASLAAAGCGGSHATPSGGTTSTSSNLVHGARWVTAWEAPAVDAAGLGFSNQTLRLIVTPHTAGTQARIVLSNAFGSRAVTITAATIARRTTGPNLTAGTVRRLTFGGRGSVTIPAGQQVQSDPTTISLAPFEDIAVSLAFGAPTGPPTNHYNGLQTSYYSPVGSGDRTGSLDGTEFTEGTPSRFFLTAVEVLASASAKTVVAAGDSITDGGAPSPDTIDQNARWPDFLQRRLLTAGSSCSMADAGISGNQVTHSRPPSQLVGGPSLENRLDRDVLSQPNLGGIIVLEGLNDILLTTSPADNVIAGLKGIASRAHAERVPVLIGTLTPVRGGLDATPTAEAIRSSVNDWIRSQHVFDGVIDFAKVVAGSL